MEESKKMDVLNDPKYSYLVKKQPYYKIFKTLFYYYSKAVFAIYTPVTVQGQENIPDGSFKLVVTTTATLMLHCFQYQQKLQSGGNACCKRLFFIIG